LTAPSARSAGGVTLAGQSFGPRTSTGVLAGPPQVWTVSAVRGRYAVSLPAASAALLELPASAAGSP